MVSNIIYKNNIKGDMKLFELESTVNLQTSHSKSLRTTVPVEIVQALDLSDKDKLRWTVSVENNELVCTVNKKQ